MDERKIRLVWKCSSCGFTIEVERWELEELSDDVINGHHAIFCSRCGEEAMRVEEVKDGGF